MTISLGVAGLSIRLQRERADDNYACPYCNFVDAAPPLSQAAVWAQQTGIAEQRVIHLLLTHEPLTAADIAAAVAAGRIRQDQSAELVGRRLADVVGQAYAQATVVPSPHDRVDVSTPYVSWMAGILGAAEIVKIAYGLPLIERRVDLDLSGLPAGFVLPAERDQSGRCLCWSSVRRRWARRLYG
jgi:hypothetical protein